MMVLSPRRVDLAQTYETRQAIVRSISTMCLRSFLLAHDIGVAAFYCNSIIIRFERRKRIRFSQMFSKSCK
jgi:hypothetical protein